ncbi:Kinase-like protein [Mycena kentingensis (nom. inval.)]|nr:Kinase-like protein [Mycena kentingensis (nom. inval.)]
MPPSRTELHPSLDRRNIQRLPYKQRIYASAALNIYELPSKLRGFISDLSDGKTNFDIPVILPIVYANLAGFNPPDSANIEERTREELVIRVLRPICALQLLSSVAPDAPPAAMPTLWPLVWRWTAHFREHHPYYVPPGGAEPQDVGLSTSVSLCLVKILRPCLRSEEQSFRDDVMSTPGLAGAIFQTWSLTANDRRDDSAAVTEEFHEGLFDYLDYASRDSQQSRVRLDFDDVAEAVGGVRDLAATILHTIHTDLAGRTEDEQARGLRTMFRLLDLLSPSAQGHTPFWNALLEQHITASVVTRTCACFSSLDRATQRHAFFFIMRSLKYSTDPAHLAAAVDAGLLLLLSKAMTETPPVDLAEQGWLPILSQGLVHRAVVAAIQRAFPNLTLVMREPQLRQPPYPPYYRPFINFVTLYRLREEILEEVRAGSRPARPRSVQAKSTVGCQRADWIAGHRATCPGLAPSLTILRDPPRLAIQGQLNVVLPGKYAAAVPPPPRGTPDFSKLMFGRNATFFRAVVERDARGLRTRADANAAKRSNPKENPPDMHAVVDYSGEKGVGVTTVMRRIFCGEDVPAGYTVVVIPLGQYAARCVLNARGLDAPHDYDEEVVEQRLDGTESYTCGMNKQ